MEDFDIKEALRRQALARLARQKGVVRPDMGDSETDRIDDADKKTLDQVEDVAAFLGADLKGRSPASDDMEAPSRVQPTLPESADEDTMRQILRAKMLRDRSGY